jgi:hypothetical protein
MMSVPVNGGQASGVEQSDAILEWLWDNFSAVASDNPTFERWRKWRISQITTKATLTQYSFDNSELKPRDPSVRMGNAYWGVV